MSREMFLDTNTKPILVTCQLRAMTGKLWYFQCKRIRRRKLLERMPEIKFSTQRESRIKI